MVLLACVAVLMMLSLGGMLLSTGVIHTSATETKGANLIQNSKPGILFICSL